MKRPIGVVFAAVILLLGSLFQLLMALCMALSAVFLPHASASGGVAGTGPAVPMPGWMPMVMYAMCAFFVALAVWGFTTTVGLFRLRRWARYSVMVIGGALALIGFISVLSTLVMMAISLPMPTKVDPAQAQSTQAFAKGMFAVIAFFYAVVCAIGVSWLVYFNRKAVREVFGGAPGAMEKSRRPLIITVLSVLNLIGAASCVLIAPLPIPGLLFGVVLHGLGKAALYLGFAALSAAVGVGLWQLKEWGRRLTLAMMVFGLAQSVVYLLSPSLLVRYTAEVNRSLSPTQPQLPAQFQSTIYMASFGFGILFCVAIGWALIYYRGAFGRPAESSVGDATALP
jgi:hypothetical protein